MKSLNNYDNNDLLKRLRSGDQTAFSVVFRLYYNSVLKNISHIISDSNTAHDLLQEVFIAFWEKRTDFSNDLNIKGWLFTVSYNKSISYLRKKNKNICKELSENDIYIYDSENDLSFNNNKKLNLLYTAINILSPKLKEAFTLYKINNKSYQTISKEMHITQHTARQYVKLAMIFLRKYIQKHPLEFSLAILFLKYHII